MAIQIKNTPQRPQDPRSQPQTSRPEFKPQPPSSPAPAQRALSDFHATRPASSGPVLSPPPPLAGPASPAAPSGGATGFSQAVERTAQWLELASPQIRARAEAVFLKDARERSRRFADHVVIQQGSTVFDPVSGRSFQELSQLGEAGQYRVAGRVGASLLARLIGGADGASARSTLRDGGLPGGLAGIFRGVLNAGGGPSEAELKAAIRSAAQQAGLNSAHWEGVYTDYREQYGPREAAILTRADILSERAKVLGEVNFTRNDYLIMYEAAEIRTGVPAEVLRAAGVGEGLAGKYEEAFPRQFIVVTEASDDFLKHLLQRMRPAPDGTWIQVFRNPETGQLKVSLDASTDRSFIDGGWQVFPVTLGMDKDLKDADADGDKGEVLTIGLGIHQVTLNKYAVENALNDSNYEAAFRGIPVDVERLILDPVYNIEIFAQGLIAYSSEYDLSADMAQWSPENWGTLAAGIQGTRDNGETEREVINTLTDPTFKPDWNNAEPDLLDVSVPEPSNPDAAGSVNYPLYQGP